ncbi:MAG: hypothetical protein V1684_00385 [bacterium]
MTLPIKIILMVIIGLAIIAGAVWFIFFNQQQEPAVVQAPANQPVRPATPSLPPAATNNSTNVSAPALPVGGSSADQTKATLARLAASFSERFGSYSNQSDYANFEDLYDFMTTPMKRWSEEIVAELRARAKGNNSIYFGVTTKALSSTIANFDEDNGLAEALVKTQRREATGSTSNARIYYQDIIIKFVKEKGVWLVDGAFWQEI